MVESDVLSGAAINNIQTACKQNDIKFAAIFGSIARGTANPESDIDILVKFSVRKTLLDLVRIERELSEVLERKVDLVTENSLSPYIRDRIKDDLLVVYDEG